MQLKKTLEIRYKMQKNKRVVPVKITHISAAPSAAYLKITYAAVGTWLMHLCKIPSKIGVFTNYVDPDETPQNAASHQGLRFLSC